jgi:hypothetical protein
MSPTGGRFQIWCDRRPSRSADDSVPPHHRASDEHCCGHEPERGLLLSALGFRGALFAMASGVFVVLVCVLTSLPAAIGQAKKKTAFSGILSNSSGINRLSLARLALFAVRDVWFVVSLPIFLSSVLGWSLTQVGGFMALWVIAYGAVQSVSPMLLARVTHGGAPGPVPASALGIGLAGVTALIPIGLRLSFPPAATMLGGLVLFGIVFALNSSVHSYLVLAYSEADRVSLSVGFYYMANACGRLLGTLLSGVLYQQAGVSASLWGAVVLAAAAGIGALFLPPVTAPAVSWAGAKGDD